MLSSTRNGALAPAGGLRRGPAAAAPQPGRAAPLSVALAVLATAAGLMLVRAGASNATVALAAGAIWSACAVLSVKLLRLDPFSPAMIYLYLLGLFHLGLVVPWALSVEVSAPPLWLITRDLNPALALVMIAFASYHAGAVLAVWLWPAPEAHAVPKLRCYNGMLCAAGLAIASLGVLAFCGGVQSLGIERLLRADYAETYTLASRYDPRLFATSMTLVPLGLYLAAASAGRGVLAWVLVLGALWGGAVLFLGFRGYALVPAITIFAVLHRRGLRPPRVAYVAGVLALLTLIPLVRALRANHLAGRGISAALSLTAPVAALEEMGGSLRPLVHTVEFLDNEPFRWGQTYWQGLLSAVPNLAFSWQGGEYLPFEKLPPNHWMTLQAAPHSYRAHGGLGFSAVAEPYMNFGVPGVAAYFFLLALLLVAACRFDAGRPTRLASWAVVLGPLLWTVRNDFHGFFRPVILGLAAIAVVRLFSNSWQGLWGRSQGRLPRRVVETRAAGIART